MSNWMDFLRDNEDRFVSELAEFVRIPSISTVPEHRPDVERAAAWVAQRLKAAGMENVEVMSTGGHPAVYGDWLHAGSDKPTILLYGHYDVQPPDPLDSWDSPPFEPRVENGCMFGRGTSDDKGSMLTPILATESLMRTERCLPVNVRFCFEGEEEILSPSMGSFLESNKERFAADLILNADSFVWDPDTPMVVLGSRGLSGVQISVKGATSDLHSGLHGGVLNNPIEALSRLIASMRHEDGRIAIEGFFDDVVELEEEERLAISKVPFDGDAYRRELGISEFFGEPSYSTRERNWIRPTLELNGIWGGFQGEGVKTVIPGEAHAKITCRLVANQTALRIHELIKAHVETNTPPGVRVEVRPLGSFADPYSLSTSHPGNRIKAEILTEVFNGRAPYYVYVGGTLPIANLFRRHLKTDAVGFGWSVTDENLHAPNEFFRLCNFHRGIKAYCLILLRMASETSSSLK